MAATTLSKCTSTELETLLKIAKATFVETFGHLNDPAHFDAYVAKAFTLAQFEKELSTPGSDFYLLRVDGHAAGYLKLNFPPAQSDLNEPQSMEIERIYLYNQYQGSGLGKLLFNKAMEEAANAEVKYIWLGVWEKNEKAIRFYESRGFYKFAKHPFKLGDDLQSDDLMRLDL